MKKLSFSIGLVMMLGAAVALTGCQSTQLEKGVTAENGTLHTVLDGTPKQVIEGAKAAFNKMDLVLVDAESGQFNGKAVARTDNYEQITVKADRKDHSSSDVSVKVGSKNAESLGLSLLNSIKEQIPKQDTKKTSK